MDEYFRIYENIKGRSELGFGNAASRWTRYGVPIIYFSNSVSLNFTEMLSIKGRTVSSSKWILATISIEGDIPEIQANDLPKDWTQRPYPESTQNFGADWAQERFSLCLKVPSCRIPLSAYPREHNLLVNPFHPAFNTSIKVLNKEVFSFELNGI